jgi:hypothetical protein
MAEHIGLSYIGVHSAAPVLISKFQTIRKEALAGLLGKPSSDSYKKTPLPNVGCLNS